MEDEEEESRGDVAMDEVFIPPLLPLPSFFPFIFFFFSFLNLPLPPGWRCAHVKSGTALSGCLSGWRRSLSALVGKWITTNQGK